jgi:hypothetical protein
MDLQVSQKDNRMWNKSQKYKTYRQIQQNIQKNKSHLWKAKALELTLAELHVLLFPSLKKALSCIWWFYFSVFFSICKRQDLKQLKTVLWML